VVSCVIFGFIGAARDPDEPGIAGSRMARKVGAPVGLLVIFAAEGILRYRKSQREKQQENNQRT
jgi:hypothetical protein